MTIREKVDSKIAYGQECQKSWKTEYPVLGAFTPYDFESCRENGDWMKLPRRKELATEANKVLTEVAHGRFIVEEEKEAELLVKKFGWSKIGEYSQVITNPGTGFTSNRTFAIIEN